MSSRSRIKSTSCICVLIFLFCDLFSQKKKNVFNLLSHEKDGTLIWTSPINYASGSLARKIFVFIVLFCSGLRCPILLARCTRVGWNLVVRSPARVGKSSISTNSQLHLMSNGSEGGVTGRLECRLILAFSWNISRPRWSAAYEAMMVLVWSLSPVVGPVCTAATSAPSIQVGTTLEAGEGSGHQGRRSGGHPAWWQESGKRVATPPRTF